MVNSLTESGLANKHKQNAYSPKSKDNKIPTQKIAPERKKGTNIINIIGQNTYADELILGGVLVAAGIAKRKSIAQFFSGKGKPIKEDLGKKFSELEEKINHVKDDVINNVKNHINEKTAATESKISELDGATKTKMGEVEQKIEGVSTKVNNVETKAATAVTTANAALQKAGAAQAANGVGAPFVTKTVEVNGNHFTFAHSGYELDEATKRELQTESAARILGIKRGFSAPKDETFFRFPTAEIRPFTNAGGLSIVPKELAQSLIAMVNERQKINVVLDTPLYQGRIKNNDFLKLIKDKDGYKYIELNLDPNTGKKTNEKITHLDLIKEMEVPITTDKGISKEKVRLFSAKKQEEISADIAEQYLTPELKEEIAKTIEKSEDKTFRQGGFIAKREGENATIKYYTELKYVFYDNDKFNLNIPKTIVDTKAINMYNNNAVAAGETERFIYFSKFFYEHLNDLHKNEGKAVFDKKGDKLKADVIIGNDWHTGPIAAMIRQLTPVRKSFSEIDPESADQLKNIPIISLMHNAGCPGNVWFSQEKLMNVMFDHHTANIVENSQVINSHINGHTQGLQQKLWNPFFNGTDIHPQAMLAHYSDMIIPVSDNYAKEIATSDFGRDYQPVFKIRARLGEFSDKSNILTIAKNSGLNIGEKEMENLQKPTMIGITNGCEKLANSMTESVVEQITQGLGLKHGALTPYSKEIQDLYAWRQSNKKVVIENLIARSKDPANPMKIKHQEITDLTGVNENTPVIGSAGRLVNQKGIDILHHSIEKFYQKYQGHEAPVIYVQGQGDLMADLVKMKKELVDKYPDKAKRIVVADLFNEKGYYKAAQTMSDFWPMTSWEEPCGLVHKEGMPLGGMISIVKKVGGLASGLTDGKNALFVDFEPLRGTESEEEYLRKPHKNADAVANKMIEPCEIAFKNPE
ncbi:MAG: glycogen/starch synthase, partial [Candidatus Gastranaerophilales bacterium]|nr:glycogen/starch synthase [Candidatus Gastranaerophilales bacterium]